MTYEEEMKQFLESKKLLADEGTYPKELMAQITIKAFGELQEHIQELTEELVEVEGELETCEEVIETLSNKLNNIKLVIT